jgi:hypothetical protein
MREFCEETQQKEEKTQWKFGFNMYWNACKKIKKMEFKTFLKLVFLKRKRDKNIISLDNVDVWD